MLVHIFYDVTESRRTEEQLHLAIQSIMSDASWFSREVIARLNHVRIGGSVDTYKPIDLSSREREVLMHVALGWDNKRIAEVLGLRPQTVRNYITNIYNKLGVRSRAEAIVWARDNGMTSP